MLSCPSLPSKYSNMLLLRWFLGWLESGQHSVHASISVCLFGACL